jgi:hypothetical protein
MGDRHVIRTGGIRRDATPPDRELAKVVLGPPGLQAHVPVRSSELAWVRRLFRRDPLSALVQVPYARAHVHAAEDDDGTIDVWLTVANMGPRQVNIEQFYLEQCLANGTNFSVTVPMFTPPQEPLTPRAFREVYFRIPIQAPAIRHLIRVMQPAQNLRSSPRVELTISGSLDLRTGKARDRVRFTVPIRLPELNLSAPSAGK